MEGRGCRSKGIGQGKTEETLRSEIVSTRLAKVAELARKNPGMVITTLAHHIDKEFLEEAWRRTRKDGAPGIDGTTAAEYEAELDVNLQDLLNRFKRGDYYAPPVRRVNLPKGDGKTRPIGIPTLEDKVLQRAVTMVLEAVYEQDFMNCSYGFRPRRSAHDALKVLRDGLMEMRGGWVLDVDIKSFFDTIDHKHLRGFLDQRVCDGVIRRAIDKWLKAGVFESGAVHYPREGTPQGGVISPLLANVYLHEVLDRWFEETVKPQLAGRGFLIRYADDFVIVLERGSDARRVMKALPQRFERYGLTLHPEKTRMIWFGRPGKKDGSDPPPPAGPGSFDLLGFTHIWAKSRNDHWVVKQRTAKGRLRKALARVSQWCEQNRHLPVREQWKKLCAMIVGHCAYYGITGNSSALERFRHELGRLWKYWLGRRSQRAHLTWGKFELLLERYPLPPAIAVRSELRRA